VQPATSGEDAQAASWLAWPRPGCGPGQQTGTGDRTACDLGAQAACSSLFACVTSLLP